MQGCGHFFRIIITIVNCVAMVFMGENSVKAEDLSYFQQDCLALHDPAFVGECNLRSNPGESAWGQRRSRNRAQLDYDAVSNFLALFTIVSDHLALKRVEHEQKQQDVVVTVDMQIELFVANQTLKVADPFNCVNIESFAVYNCSSVPNISKYKSNIGSVSANEDDSNKAQSLASFIEALKSFGRSRSFSGSRSDLPQGSHLFCLTPSECKFFGDLQDKIKEENPSQVDFTPDTLTYEETQYLVWFFRNLTWWVTEYLGPGLFQLISPAAWYTMISKAVDKSVSRIFTSGAIAMLMGVEPRGVVVLLNGAITFEILKEIVYQVAYIFSPIMRWLFEMTLPVSDSVCRFYSYYVSEATFASDGWFGVLNSRNLCRNYSKFRESITTNDHYIASNAKFFFKLYDKLTKGTEYLGNYAKCWLNSMFFSDEDALWEYNQAFWQLIEYINSFLVKYMQKGKWI
ncbi:MAG: hypothetical protein BGO28_04480 [Alphaproteobacteria bacterium 43-37]|nr:MAG: hypothetical protein BGO28_04480 [Alphaproteobacteria bacterium 43-37]